MLARDRRKALRLSQQEVADRAGVSRKWVSDFELGKAGSDFSIVLRLLTVLDLRIQILPAGHPPTDSGAEENIDLDTLLAGYTEHNNETRTGAGGRWTTGSPS